MKIIIKNEIIENATWEFQDMEGEYFLTFTNDTLSHVAGICEDAKEIELYNDDELVGKWYVLELVFIKNMGDGKIIADFKASTISDAREKALTQSISDTEDVLLEVAGLVAEINSAQADTEGFLNQYKGRVEDTIQTFDNVADQFNERVNEQNKTIGQVQSLLNQIQDDLTAVQTALASMPQNVNERFSELDNRYNALADRVAMLENKEE